MNDFHKKLLGNNMSVGMIYILAARSLLCKPLVLLPSRIVYEEMKCKQGTKGDEETSSGAEA